MVSSRPSRLTPTPKTTPKQGGRRPQLPGPGRASRGCPDAAVGGCGPAVPPLLRQRPAPRSSYHQGRRHDSSPHAVPGHTRRGALCGNFDMILGPFSTHFPPTLQCAASHAPHDVLCVVLYRARGCWMLIGACTPMVGPIRAFRPTTAAPERGWHPGLGLLRPRLPGLRCPEADVESCAVRRVRRGSRRRATALASGGGGRRAQVPSPHQ